MKQIVNILALLLVSFFTLAHSASATTTPSFFYNDVPLDSISATSSFTTIYIPRFNFAANKLPRDSKAGSAPSVFSLDKRSVLTGIGILVLLFATTCFFALYLNTRKKNQKLRIKYKERTAALAKQHEQDLLTANNQLSEEIDKRQSVENELHKLSTWFTSMHNALEDAVILTTQDRSMVNINSSAERMFGFTKDELQQQTTQVLHVDKEHFKKFNTRIQSALTQKKPPTFQYLLKRKNGEIFPTEHIVTQLTDEHGEPFGILSIIKDITHRKIAEDTLRQERNRAQKYLDVAGVMLLVLSTGGIVELINKKGCEILGHNEEEILGMDWIENFIPPEHTQELRDFFQNIDSNSGPIPDTHENPIVTSTGEIRIISWNNIALHDDTGGLQGILSSGRDITEQRRNQTKLMEVLDFNQKIISASAGGIIAYKESGQCVTLNKAAEKMVGGTHDQILQQNFRQIRSWQESGLLDLALHVLKTGKKDSMELHTVTSYGKEVWLDCVLSSFVSSEENHLLLMVNDVTNRKQGEQALRLSEERLRISQSIAHVGTWDWNIKHGALAWSDEMFSIFGLSSKTFIPTYKSFVASVHPEDRPLLSDAVRTALEGTSQYNVEHRIIRSDGRVRVVEQMGEVFTDDTGMPSRMVGVVLDITERKHAEAERDIFFNVSLDMICIGTTDGYLRQFSPSWTDTLGWSKQDMLTTNYLEFVHPDDRVATRRTLATLQQGHKVEAFDNRNLCRDGSYRWLSWKAIFDNEKGLIYAVARDVQEQKELEENLRIFRLFAENSGQGFYITTLDTQLVYTNNTFLHLVGHSENQLLNKKSLLQFYPNEMTAYLESEVLDTVRNKGQWTGELQLLSKENQKIPVIQNFFILKDEKLQPLYIAAVTTDVTRQKHIEHELRAARFEADEANKAKSEFLANMSHEIRTPMNAITGLTHLLLETKMTPHQLEYGKKILNATRSLLHLINDILDLSKVESGALVLEKITFNLEDVFADVCTVVGMEAAQKDLELLFCFAPDMPLYVQGDPVRLNQILINLAGNAVKFTTKGHVAIYVSPGKIQDNSIELKFTIADTGIGIVQEAIPTLFDLFSQADGSTTRKHGGTGLGLAISKRFVQLMGGKISVSSTPNVGSEFTFTALFELTEKTPTPEISADIQKLKAKKVLIVDSNATSREVLRIYLESMDIFVTEAATETSAVECVRESRMPFDLIFLDWSLTDTGCMNTFKRLLMECTHPTPYVVVAPVHKSNKVVHTVQGERLINILYKPFCAFHLREAMLVALGLEFSRQKTERVEPTSESLDPGQYTLLVVEDNSINREVARSILEQGGFTVTVVEDGAQAVAITHQQQFDAILMDVQMPVMDGLEATRNIRKTYSAEELPIIAMTAHAMVGDKERCLNAGMNDHIAKPIDPDSLFGILKRWLSCVQEPTQQTSTAPTPMEQKLPDALPGLEIAQALGRISYDETLYKKLARMFVNDFADVGSKIQSLLEAEDNVAAQMHMHSLKGAASTLGAMKQG